MATIHGMVDSYDNTVPQKRMVTDRILMADVFERRTIDALGLNNSAKFRFANEPGRTYDWMEDTFVGRSDTLTASGGMASSSTTTTCVVTTPKLFNVGDVLLIDAEYIWVSAVNTSTGVLTIVRNRGGTQATHANSTTVTIVGVARAEGADANDSPSTEASSTTNCSQIFQRTVHVSRNEKIFPNWGVDDMVDWKITKRMKELVMFLNLQAYYGQRQAGSSSHTQGRGFGGFDTFISTNTTAAGSVDLTRGHIDALLEDIYGYGGAPDLILCNTYQQRRLNEIYAGLIRTERTERTGGNRITYLEHPIAGPPVEIVVDRHCPSTKLYMIDRRYCGYITIDPFFYEMLAKDGDSEKGEVVGEYGFVMAFEKSHASITGLTDS